ncbi:MAG: putative PQQ-dependent dehydrogenase 4, partial [Rhizobacter sp.]|nr:putative PQQ-dependent dehydrogenase 4 [Rhizobacter sp.]
AVARARQVPTNKVHAMAPPRSRPWITGSLFALFGLALLLGGVWLASLSGSLYYLIAGLVLLASGIQIARGRLTGLWLYALLLLGTVVWSLAEVGLDLWQLMPRLFVPGLLGLYLLMPRVTRRLHRHSETPSSDAPATPWLLATTPLLVALVALVATGVAAASRDHSIHGEWSGSLAAAVPDNTTPDNDWHYYGRTPRGERFAPAGQITPENVKQLRLAWSLRTGDTEQPGENQGGTDGGHEFNFEVTPIKVGNALYVCTPHSWVVAIDAETGKQLWKFDPHANTQPDVYLSCRGVSYYEAPAGKSSVCPRRILAPVLDARIVALNADTGQPCEDFGSHGFISLTQYLGDVPPGFHFVTSPPLVVADRMLLGGWIRDNVATHEPSGAVRAFDPVSGGIVWAWDVGHPDQPIQHPGPNDVLTRGTPNAWGAYTADAALGLVYLPMGNATPDYYGAHRRPFDDKYSSSIVALDIATGQPRWSYQTVHHDLWDMDLPIGPSLVDLPDAQGNPVPALVQSTKRGEFFMLDRRTGQPIAEVTEKPVPQDGAPGERLSRTQPYSTGMPSLTPPDLTEAQMWGATPIDQMLCRIQFRQAHYEGQFTPPTTQETIVVPAFDGIIDWHGASIDPVRKLLVANSSYIPFLIKLTPQAYALEHHWIDAWNGTGAPPEPKKFGVAPQYGTPFVGEVHPWLNGLGVPCKAPPWGQLTAIDLRTRKIVWQHDVGTTRDTGPFNLHFNLPLPTGIFNIGGNLLTQSGLVFMGATADDYLRAFDERNGRELWRARLPAGGQATPMSYTAGNGKQYVVIAAGGHGGLGTRPGDYVQAFSLSAP